MSQQKQKFSLTDFLKDTSFGGDSWADDDDFDPSSISLPTHSHFSHENAGLSYHGSGHTDSSGSRFNLRPLGPSSPPFIVKISNVPSQFALIDIEDLFHSRFMKYVKLKLFWEIDLNVLNTAKNPIDALNTTKKVAFVELYTSNDADKVLKWTNLYLDRGMGRLAVHLGNFNDFKTYNDLNQQVPENMDPSLSSSKNRHRGRNSFSQPHPLHQQQPHTVQGVGASRNVPNNHEIKSHQLHVLPPLIEPKPAVMTKSNPFGKAKPVDTLKKEMELEKQLEGLQVNKTTFKTLGSIAHTKQQGNQLKPAEDEAYEKQPLSPRTQNPKLSFKKDASKSPCTDQTVTLVPAPTPEVTAWGTLPLLPASSDNSLNIGPPLQSFGKISSSASNDRKVKNDSASKVREDKGKKTILKRKNVDHKRSKIILKDLSKKVTKDSDDQQSPENGSNNDVNKIFAPNSVSGTENRTAVIIAKESVSVRLNEPLMLPTSIGGAKQRKIKPKKVRKERKPKEIASSESSSISDHESKAGTTKDQVSMGEKSTDLEKPHVTANVNTQSSSENSSRGRGRGKVHGHSSRGGRGGHRDRAPLLSERVWVRNKNQTTETDIEKESPSKVGNTKSHEPEVKLTFDSNNTGSASENRTQRPLSGRGRSRGRGRGGRGRAGFGNWSRTYNTNERGEDSMATKTNGG